eukprot:EG_transcript_14873
MNIAIVVRAVLEVGSVSSHVEAMRCARFRQLHKWFKATSNKFIRPLKKIASFADHIGKLDGKQYAKHANKYLVQANEQYRSHRTSRRWRSPLTAWPHRVVVSVGQPQQACIRDFLHHNRVNCWCCEEFTTENKCEIVKKISADSLVFHKNKTLSQ